MTAKKLELSWAWYFARRSVADPDRWHCSIRAKRKSRPSRSAPRRSRARIGGIELIYKQPFGVTSYGFTSNVGRDRTKVHEGRQMAVASEYAANIGVYVETDMLSARLVSNYRSE